MNPEPTCSVNESRSRKQISIIQYLYVCMYIIPAGFIPPGANTLSAGFLVNWL
jgi:hypothetical protein